ncbi:MAG: alpha/beta hydrolase [Betaproteobacteria bacterium]|nr:alpha/beta hydrolase [Betaproteobacteria bacterium]
MPYQISEINPAKTATGMTLTWATRLAAAAAALVLAVGPAVAKDDNILRLDHYVRHVSTVPVNAGQVVDLFMRERVAAGLNHTLRSTEATGKVVLFIHGGTVPSVPDYDLDYKDYNWMAYLAKAGFDTFSLDHTGYGRSPRLTMDDPCNMNPADQPLLIPNPLSAPCPHSYPFTLTTSQSDWDEIHTAVEYIKRIRNVEKVHLVGWSAGGPRAGGYAGLHPENVDRVLLYAPSPPGNVPSTPPAVVPRPGFPMNTQTREELETGRWASEINCVDQRDPGILEPLWNTIMDYDDLGSVWGTPPGLMRTRTAVSWGWNPSLASQITAPLLLITGDGDSTPPSVRRATYDLANSASKVFIEVQCASHFMVWEYQHMVLFEGSKHWFLNGSIKGVSNGEIIVDPTGKYHKQ